MKVSKSTPLVLYLLKFDIPFKSDGDILIIDDKEYKSLTKKLAKDPNRKWMIKSMQLDPEEVGAPKEPKEKKPRKHEVFRRVIEDAPKIIQRPPAVYSNPNYKTLYL